MKMSDPRTSPRLTWWKSINCDLNRKEVGFIHFDFWMRFRFGLDERMNIPGIRILYDVLWVLQDQKYVDLRQPACSGWKSLSLNLLKDRLWSSVSGGATGFGQTCTF